MEVCVHAPVYEKKKKNMKWKSEAPIDCSGGLVFSSGPHSGGEREHITTPLSLDVEPMVITYNNTS